jgi:hypothetical protein
MIEDMTIRRLVPKTQQGYIRNVKAADSDEVARAFRDDVARYSDMMSPGVRCLAGG